MPSVLPSVEKRKQSSWGSGDFAFQHRGLFERAVPSRAAAGTAILGGGGGAAILLTPSTTRGKPALRTFGFLRPRAGGCHSGSLSDLNTSS